MNQFEIETALARTAPNIKRKQTLNERLGAFFGIEGEAVTWDAEASEYRCRFRLTPD